MILLPRAVRIYVATQPTNLRQSFDGLAALARSVLARDPLSGHVFVFLNGGDPDWESSACGECEESRIRAF